MLQVLGWVPDGTQLVLDENQFNSSPPPGSAFTLVSVALGYFGFEDPASLFGPTISAVGGSSVELSGDCGVLPDDLDIVTEIFSGGVVIGNVCFVTTPPDLERLTLYGSGELFGGTQSFLGVGEVAMPAMTVLRGPQAGSASTSGRLGAATVGSVVPIGADWELQVNGARDGTDEVLAENQFNDPPPNGYRFLIIDVVLTYTGSATGSVFDLSIDAVSDSNVSLSSSCGVTPGELDFSVDLFPGGQLAGTICFVVPQDDLDSVVVYASESFSFDDSRAFLATMPG